MAFFGMATALGFGTYISEKSQERSWITNIANSTDLIATWSIFFTLIFFGNHIRYTFNHFELFCILLIFVTFIYWFVRKNSQVANVVVNLIITIAYLPTIYGLWLATESTEPLNIWLIVLIAQIFALYNPIRKKDYLALLYAVRATILVGIVVILIARFYV